jgi:hypothetical protein
MIVLDGNGAITGLTATGISAVQQLPNPAVVTTLNAPSGVLATQNGMTGIAKAWVQFAGASGTINGSFNVSSVTRNSTGYYTVNLTTAMPNANYCATTAVSTTAGTGAATAFMFTNGSYTATAPTTSSFLISTVNFSSTYADPAYVNIAVFSS